MSKLGLTFSVFICVIGLPLSSCSSIADDEETYLGIIQRQSVLWNFQIEPNISRNMAKRNEFHRVELMNLAACTYRLFSEKDSAVRNKHNIIARAVSALLFDLYTMQRTYEIMNEATFNIEVDDWIYPNDYNGTSSFHQWMIAINETMYNDPLLKDEYHKRSFLNEVISVVLQPSERALHDCLKPARAANRAADFNKFFFKQTFGDSCNCAHMSNEEHQRHLLARAMIKLAKYPDARPILNDIYMNALMDVFLMDFGQGDAIFEALRERLQEEPDVASKIKLTMSALELQDAYIKHIDELIP